MAAKKSTRKADVVAPSHADGDCARCSPLDLPLAWPEGVSHQEGFRQGDARAAAWLAEIERKSRPISSSHGLANPYALIAVIRRALESESHIDRHALRSLLSHCQEAVVRFQADPLGVASRRRYLRQRPERIEDDDEE